MVLVISRLQSTILFPSPKTSQKMTPIHESPFFHQANLTALRLCPNVWMMEASFFFILGDPDGGFVVVEGLTTDIETSLQSLCGQRAGTGRSNPKETTLTLN